MSTSDVVAWTSFFVVFVAPMVMVLGVPMMSESSQEPQVHVASQTEEEPREVTTENKAQFMRERVVPRNVFIATVGRTYEFEMGWLTEQRNEAQRFIDFMIDFNRLYARVVTRSDSIFITESIMVVVTDTGRSSEGIRIVRVMLPDGRQYWTLPNFLNEAP